jgi:hypothetical protein
MKFKSPSIHRTSLYRAKSAYSSMLARCGNANGKNPSYEKAEVRMTLKEWLDWAIPEYERCILMYPNESPSVSRLNDCGHYEIGNIEIIPMFLNRKQQKCSFRGNQHVKPGPQALR